MSVYFYFSLWLCVPIVFYIDSSITMQCHNIIPRDRSICKSNYVKVKPNEAHRIVFFYFFSQELALSMEHSNSVIYSVFRGL